MGVATAQATPCGLRTFKITYGCLKPVSNESSTKTFISLRYGPTCGIVAVSTLALCKAGIPGDIARVEAYPFFWVKWPWDEELKSRIAYNYMPMSAFVYLRILER